MDLYYLNFHNITSEDEEMVKTKYPKRYEKALRYQFSEDYFRCLGAYILLDKYYVPFEESELTLSKKGKPIIANKPYISYTHSDEFVVLAISNSLVGVDVEQIEKKNIKIQSKVLCKEELEYVNNDVDKFHEVWTSKEAILKLAGEGLIKDLSKINTLSFKEGSTYKNYTIFTKSIKFEDYIITVASTEKVEDINLIERK